MAVCISRDLSHLCTILGGDGGGRREVEEAIYLPGAKEKGYLYYRNSDSCIMHPNPYHKIWHIGAFW